MKTLLYEDPDSSPDSRSFFEQQYTPPTYEELFYRYLEQTQQVLGQNIPFENKNPFCRFVEDGSDEKAPIRVVQATLLLSKNERGQLISYPVLNLTNNTYTTSAGGHIRYTDYLYRELEEEVNVVVPLDKTETKLSVKNLIGQGGKFIPVGVVEELLASGINYVGLISFLSLPTQEFQFTTIDKDRKIVSINLEDILQIVGNTPDKCVSSYHLFAILDYLKRFGINI